MNKSIPTGYYEMIRYSDRCREYSQEVKTLRARIAELEDFITMLDSRHPCPLQPLPTSKGPDA